MINRLHELDVWDDRLDTFVHEINSHEAAGIKNSGFGGQVRYLVDLFGLDGFMQAMQLKTAICQH